MSTTAIIVIGFCITFVMTAIGSAVVFFFKGDISPKVNTLFLGFASGVMTAACVWSLLIPSIDQAEANYGSLKFIPAVAGFIIGGLFLVLLDKAVPHFHKGTSEEEGPHVALTRPAKLFLAVTIHNIPEGLAVGFAFGAAAAGGEAAYIAALGLAIGIGIQNLPEGAAVALPMKNATGSRSKAFLYGAGSGVVEPVFAVIGYFLAASLTTVLPYLLAFAAGAMFFVVAEDLIPDSKLDAHPHLGAWAAMAGFALMMVLDVALG